MIQVILLQKFIFQMHLPFNSSILQNSLHMNEKTDTQRVGL